MSSDKKTDAFGSVSTALSGLMSSAKQGLESAKHSLQSLAHLDDPLSADELRLIDGWFRACNYLTIGQIYLKENPLLQRALTIGDIKPRLLGHWGTSPGLNLVYAHANRLIKKHDCDMIYLAGPGHGGPAIVANVWLEGTWAEIYPECPQTLEGMRKLFRQFSSPGGIPSHVSADVPGSIHEGGELGYVLTHAYGAVMDSPDLIAVAVVGDGEAETGPLAGSWKFPAFLNPVFDGAVLPILHLNGYKIAGPTVFGRETDDNLRKFFESQGFDVLFVEGDDPARVHQDMAKAMDYCYANIRKIQQAARAKGSCDVRPTWPLIVLRTPKGWTGPKIVDGKPVEGTFRSHQVPLSGVREQPDHLTVLENWLKSYKPDELFGADGKLKDELLALAPKGNKRMSAQPYANGGINPKALVVPDISKYELKFDKPAQKQVGSVHQLGELCRDIYKANPHNFRMFCPDETNSNRLGAVFEVEQRASMQAVIPIDDRVAHSGRVMEVLSEHCCYGWLTGYTLTGRYGLLSSYEAFAQIFNSMTLQDVKWLQVISGGGAVEGGLPWRKWVPSINILLTSTCWRNDHNGFSHQGPSFVDTLLNKHGNVVRCYFPCDANTLLVTGEHCLSSHNRINLIVQDKQPQFQYLTLEQAREHWKARASVWQWASTAAADEKPDVVIACCGDVMTMEALAATALLREKAPGLKVRFVNVIDLLALYSTDFHPHGLSDEKFDEIFTKDVHVVMSYHAYPGSLHQLVHRRSNPGRFHVRGFRENGTTTTPFDMVVLNNSSRFELAQMALQYATNKPANADEINKYCDDMLAKHRKYVVEHLEDLPEITGWKWPF